MLTLWLYVSALIYSIDSLIYLYKQLCVCVLSLHKDTGNYWYEREGGGLVR